VESSYVRKRAYDSVWRLGWVSGAYWCVVGFVHWSAGPTLTRQPQLCRVLKVLITTTATPPPPPPPEPRNTVLTGGQVYTGTMCIRCEMYVPDLYVRTCIPQLHTDQHRLFNGTLTTTTGTEPHNRTPARPALTATNSSLGDFREGYLSFVCSKRHQLRHSAGLQNGR
jgi:hypothetical protein